MKVLTNTEIYDSCKKAFVMAISELKETDLFCTKKIDGDEVEDLTEAGEFLIKIGDYASSCVLSPVVREKISARILENASVHQLMSEVTFRFWLYCDVPEADINNWLFLSLKNTFARVIFDQAVADSLAAMDIDVLIKKQTKEEDMVLGSYIVVVLASIFYNELIERLRVTDNE